MAVGLIGFLFLFMAILVGVLGIAGTLAKIITHNLDGKGKKIGHWADRLDVDWSKHPPASVGQSEGIKIIDSSLDPFDSPDVRALEELVAVPLEILKGQAWDHYLESDQHKKDTKEKEYPNPYKPLPKVDNLPAPGAPIPQGMMLVSAKRLDEETKKAFEKGLSEGLSRKNAYIHAKDMTVTPIRVGNPLSAPSCEHESVMEVRGNDGVVQEFCDFCGEFLGRIKQKCDHDKFGRYHKTQNNGIEVTCGGCETLLYTRKKSVIDWDNLEEAK